VILWYWVMLTLLRAAKCFKEDLSIIKLMILFKRHYTGIDREDNKSGISIQVITDPAFIVFCCCKDEVSLDP
jgi:hypothetical protein